MAKSLRSKRKRKMRSVKREQYAKKELDRLKNMIEKSKEAESEMKELYTVKSPAQMKAVKKPLEDEEEGEVMDITKPKQPVDPITLKTPHGNYPVWMNQRQIKKRKKEQKKVTKEKARKKRQQIHI